MSTGIDHEYVVDNCFANASELKFGSTFGYEISVLEKEALVVNILDLTCSDTKMIKPNRVK